MNVNVVCPALQRGYHRLLCCGGGGYPTAAEAAGGSDVLTREEAAAAKTAAGGAEAAEKTQVHEARRLYEHEAAAWRNDYYPLAGRLAADIVCRARQERQEQREAGGVEGARADREADSSPEEEQVRRTCLRSSPTGLCWAGD